MNENSNECPLNFTTNDYDMGTTIGITPSNYTYSTDINLSAVNGCNVDVDDSTFDDAIAYYCDQMYDINRECRDGHQTQITEPKTVDLRDFNSSTLTDAAHGYAEMGLSVMPLKAKTKEARDLKWSSPDYNPDAHKIWKGATILNIGVNLGKSNICTLDVDDLAAFKVVMASISEELMEKTGVTSSFLSSQTAGIKSGREGSAKLVFTVPEGITLDYHALNWFKDANKLTKKSVFELRCGSGRYDVLPPSIHPDTKQPYQWIGTDNGCTIVEIPADLLYLWTHWGEFIEKMKRLDPRYEEEEKPLVKFSAEQHGKYRGQSFIEEWNSYQPIGKMLLDFGYVDCGNTMYARPESRSKNPDTQVNIFGGKVTFYSYATGDFFCDGHQHTAFDLIQHFVFDDDFEATKNFVKEQMRDVGGGN